MSWLKAAWDKEHCGMSCTEQVMSVEYGIRRKYELVEQTAVYSLLQHWLSLLIGARKIRTVQVSAGT